MGDCVQPRRRPAAVVAALAVVLIAVGAVLARGSGVAATVGVAAVGYGIGCLVAGVFMAIGHNPWRNRRR